MSLAYRLTDSASQLPEVLVQELFFSFLVSRPAVVVLLGGGFPLKLWT